MILNLSINYRSFLTSDPGRDPGQSILIQGRENVITSCMIDPFFKWIDVSRQGSINESLKLVIVFIRKSLILIISMCRGIFVSIGGFCSSISYFRTHWTSRGLNGKKNSFRIMLLKIGLNYIYKKILFFVLLLYSNVVRCWIGFLQLILVK